MGVLVVTGGSKGIGAEICRRAAKQGWACSVNYASDAAGANVVVSEITEMGSRGLAVQADAANPDQVSTMFKQVDAELSAVTGLVNNAGVMGSTGRVEELDADKSRRLFDVNILGPFLCSKEAIRRMAKGLGGAGGAIVNISSAAAKHGGPGS